MGFRKVIFWSHLISGVTIGSVLFVMAVTGALISFAPQLEEWSEKNVRYVVPSGQRLTYAEIAARTSAEFTKVPASGLIVKSNPGSSVIVQFGKEKSFYVNPYTGAILGGPSRLHEFMHFSEDLHRRLALAQKGEAVTKACNLVFLLMIISGFYLWWPRNWNPLALKASFVFNPKLNGKAKNWNWHNVIGFWVLPLFLLTSLTGLIMSYPWANNAFYRIMRSEPPPQMQKMNPKSGGEKQPALPAEPVFNWDAFIASAQEKVPAWESMMLRSPQKPDAPVSIFIQGAGGPSFARSQMTLDAATAKVTKWEPFLELNKARQGRVWVKYLHTGEAWGLVGQIFSFATGCAAILMISTGFSMAWYRFFGKSRTVKNE